MSIESDSRIEQLKKQLEELRAALDADTPQLFANVTGGRPVPLEDVGGMAQRSARRNEYNAKRKELIRAYRNAGASEEEAVATVEWEFPQMLI